MKKVEELGISPAPWSLNGHASVLDRCAAIISGQYGPYNWANARLIAAAPELYDCLWEAVIGKCSCCTTDDDGGCDYDECFVNKWRKVLEKAGGAE